MSKVLTSFLVGIGYDTKGLEAGEKRVEGSMRGVKGMALGISAALVGAFGAASASVVATARRVDELALATNNLRTSQQYVYDYGNAIRFLGGNADDALSAVTTIEQALNNLRLRGELGPLQDLALAGVDISRLTGAEDAEQFLRELASQLPELDKQQRALVQDALGLSDAVLKSLSGGVNELDRSLEKANALTGNIEQLTEDSRKLAENATIFSLAIEGIANELAEKFLPSLVGVSSWATSFLAENRGSISEGIDVLAGNPEATAGIGAGAAASVAGAGLSKLGLTGVGGALKSAGQIGIIISIADLVTPYIDPIFDKLFGVERGESDVYSGSIIRGADDIDYLNRRDRSASDTIAPQASREAVSEERMANADAIAGALSKSPIKVNSSINLAVELDGQAIEAKIIDVTEREAFNTLDDITTTTER